MGGYAAVVLAGGAARRLGGAAKPVLKVGGEPMLARVLAAVADAEPRIVVGPPQPLPAPGLRWTLEDPPGGGPVAATAAGLALVPPAVPFVALLAADLPFLHPAAVTALCAAAGAADAAGAVYVDESGRPQWLCGVWRAAALRDRLATLPGGPAGAALGALLRDLPAALLRAEATDPPPWYDCDTADDLRRAEGWARGAHP